MQENELYGAYIDNLYDALESNFKMNIDNQRYILLDSFVLSLNENAMTWLFKVYLQEKYEILEDDNLTNTILEKYKSYDLKIYNLSGNLFFNKDLLIVLLNELQINNQLEFTKDNIKLV